jgi:hypothetical protein
MRLVQRLVRRWTPLVLFGVIFVVTPISGATVGDIAIVVAFDAMHTFIAPVAVVMHADGNAAWAQDHGIRHGARAAKKEATKATRNSVRDFFMSRSYRDRLCEAGAPDKVPSWHSGSDESELN